MTGRERFTYRECLLEQLAADTLCPFVQDFSAPSFPARDWGTIRTGG